MLHGSGNFFGTTYSGGASGFGSIFEWVEGSPTVTTLASFNNANGEHPTGSVIEDSSGNLFGAAANDGINFPVYGCAIAGAAIGALISFGTVSLIPAQPREVYGEPEDDFDRPRRRDRFDDVKDFEPGPAPARDALEERARSDDPRFRDHPN